MSVKRFVLPVAGGWLLLPLISIAGGPPLLQRWYPAAVPDTVPLALPYVAPVFVPADPAMEQIAYIDPVTGQLLPGPAPGTQSRETFVELRQAPVLRAGRTADGILFLETQGMEQTLTATLDASGTPHLHCGDPAHGHPAAPSPANGEQDR